VKRWRVTIHYDKGSDKTIHWGSNKQSKETSFKIPSFKNKTKKKSKNPKTYTAKNYIKSKQKVDATKKEKTKKPKKHNFVRNPYNLLPLYPTNGIVANDSQNPNNQSFYRGFKIIKSAHSTIPKKTKKTITQMELLTLNRNPKKYSNVNLQKIQKIEGWLVSEWKSLFAIKILYLKRYSLEW